MVRQLKSFAQLHEILLREIQRNAGLKGIHLQLVALPERDEKGCNWNVTAGAGVANGQRETATRLLAIVSDLQKKYNAVGKLSLNAAAADSAR